MLVAEGTASFRLLTLHLDRSTGYVVYTSEQSLLFVEAFEQTLGGHCKDTVMQKLIVHRQHCSHVTSPDCTVHCC